MAVPYFPGWRVGNLSVEIQAALLKSDTERNSSALGGTKEMDVDIRIIVASNENLPPGRLSKGLPGDLFHQQWILYSITAIAQPGRILFVCGLLQ